MRVGILCTKFSLDSSSKWLTNELADSLKKKGCAVDVFFIDWDAQEQVPCVREIINGVNVYRVAAISKNAGVKKWIFSSLRLLSIIKNTYKGGEPDLIISFSPSVTMFFPLIFINFIKKWNSFLIQWDFFPYHHRQIGLINNNIYYFFAKILENIFIRGFNNVGCMSGKNVLYLRDKYILKSNQNVSIVPIWGENSKIDFLDKELVRSKYQLPLDKKIVVFGGQLVAGRGIEEIVECAKIMQTATDIIFLVIGSGRLQSIIEKYIEDGGGNIIYLKKVSRDNYIEIISACDAGLVSTVRNVDVPSFPSKTIDYLRVGIPIIASVEKTTDYGEFIERNNLGIFVEAGNPHALVEKISFFLRKSDDIEKIKKTSPKFFENFFNVDVVVDNFLKIVFSKK